MTVVNIEKMNKGISIHIQTRGVSFEYVSHFMKTHSLRKVIDDLQRTGSCLYSNEEYGYAVEVLKTKRNNYVLWFGTLLEEK